jgi:hypothetical protein
LTWALGPSQHPEGPSHHPEGPSQHPKVSVGHKIQPGHVHPKLRKWKKMFLLQMQSHSFAGNTEVLTQGATATRATAATTAAKEFFDWVQPISPSHPGKTFHKTLKELPHCLF